MKEYILAVCGAVVLSALLLLLLPEGKTGKFIGGILKLFCLLVMMIPLFDWISDFAPKKEPIESTQTIVPDDEFLEYAFALQAEARAREIEKVLTEKFGVDTQAQVKWIHDEYACKVTKISVKIENFGINPPQDHIHILEQVKKFLAERAGQTEVVVYE